MMYLDWGWWWTLAVIVAVGTLLLLIAKNTFVARRNPKWQTVKYRHRCRMPERPPYRDELVVCRGDQRCNNWYLGKGTQWVRLTVWGKFTRGLL